MLAILRRNKKRNQSCEVSETLWDWRLDCSPYQPRNMQSHHVVSISIYFCRMAQAINASKFMALSQGRHLVPFGTPFR